MKKNLPIILRYFKTLLPALLFVCGVFAVSSFTFPASAQSTKVEVIKCYPNPASSVVNFEFQKNIDKSYVLQVYSFVGKKMVETPVMNNKITVTLNDFNRGIYVYQLRDKSGETVVAGKFQVIK
jgi:hypothetical protein